MLKAYYKLAKPGIIYGNLLTAAAGFFLASKGNIDGRLLVSLMIGMGTVMGAACVLNNILDRSIDKKMSRTKNRALATGDISVVNAIIYAGVLGTVGFATLIVYVSLLTAALGAIALLLYVVAYGVAKRRSVHGTLVGAIPGAVPPLAGYVAVTNQLDLGGLLLFIILAAWQMPHFYAIGIYRRKDYAAASIPVFPVKYGVNATKPWMFFYIVLFIIATIALTITGYSGTSFAVAMMLIGFLWLARAKRGFRVKDHDKWARGMFGFSLKVLLLFCFMLSVEAWLP